jgi:hypothetical protein
VTVVNEVVFEAPSRPQTRSSAHLSPAEISEPLHDAPHPPFHVLHTHIYPPFFGIARMPRAGIPCTIDEVDGPGIDQFHNVSKEQLCDARWSYSMTKFISRVSCILYCKLTDQLLGDSGGFLMAR